MRLLLDTCVWGGSLEPLREAGHDVEWTGDWKADPGDREILGYAHEQERILVTLDKDFGERAIVFGEPHNGIIRLVGIAAREQARYCLAVLNKYESERSPSARVGLGASNRTPGGLQSAECKPCNQPITIVATSRWPDRPYTNVSPNLPLLKR